MLNRMLTIEIARVTEAAAIAAAHWRGRGDEKLADQAAVDAMRKALNAIVEMDGLVVIGEGEILEQHFALSHHVGCVDATTV